MKHVVIVEEGADITDASLSQLIKGLELSEAKAQRLLARIPGVVTKAVERSEAELIAERFRWAGFRALTRPASEAELNEPEPLEPGPQVADSAESRPAESEPATQTRGVKSFKESYDSSELSESEPPEPNPSATQTSQMVGQAEPPVDTQTSGFKADLNPGFQMSGLQTSEPQSSGPQNSGPQNSEREEVAGSSLLEAAPSEQAESGQPSTADATKKLDFRIDAEIFDKPAAAESDATADASAELAPKTLLDQRIAEQRKRAAEAEPLPQDPFDADAFAAEASDKTGFETERRGGAKVPRENAGSSVQSFGAPLKSPISTSKSEPPDQPPRIGFQDPDVDEVNHANEVNAESPSGTIVAEDFGLLRPRTDSPLWLRRLVLALPAFLSVLVVVVYVRGSLISGITEALRWAPAAVTDVLAVSLEEGTAGTPPNALSDTLRSQMNRLQPILAAQGVELVLVTDAGGTFIAGWSGTEQLFRTPSALVNTLPLVISNARSATDGRAPSLSIPANRLNDSELPLILDSRLLDLGGAPAVLSVATPDDAATFIGQITRSSLLAGLIPVLLTLIAALAFIRKRD